MCGTQQNRLYYRKHARGARSDEKLRQRGRFWRGFVLQGFHYAGARGHTRSSYIPAFLSAVFKRFVLFNFLLYKSAMGMVSLATLRQKNRVKVFYFAGEVGTKGGTPPMA